jgi:hypothetical protein
MAQAVLAARHALLPDGSESGTSPGVRWAILTNGDAWRLLAQVLCNQRPNHEKRPKSQRLLAPYQLNPDSVCS